jgi:error-prone DNA polymerase
MVGGLAAAAGQRIVASRPCASIAQLAERAGLSRRDLKSLADAGALQSLAGHRRDAHWAAAGVESRPPMNVQAVERPAILFAPTEAEDIAADYDSLGFTLGRHPLALLRPVLCARGFSTAENLNRLQHGRRVRTAGLVTCRQRPGTASGVVFVTLEDESGCANVVVWNDLFERYRRELLGARLLGVEGRVESSDGVVHLIARRLTDHTPLLAGLLGRLEVTSHDFH